MTPSDDTVVRALRVACVRHPDRLLLLPLEAAECVPVELVDSGPEIWEAIENGPSPMSELVEGLAAHTGLTALELADSIRSFVDSLVALHLVQYQARTMPVGRS